MYKLPWALRSFHISFIPDKLHLLFTKYCITQWISKLLGSFEIHWVRLYLVNFVALAGIVNPTVYKTKPIFTGLYFGQVPVDQPIFLKVTCVYNYCRASKETM